MSASDLVARLQKSRESSPGHWIACCPAHPDKHPSLAVKEADDGRVLVHCFAGCAVGDILAAVGLDYEALFPEKPVPLKDGRATPPRLQFNPRDVLKCLRNEIDIATIVAGDIARGINIPPADRARMESAYERIEQARRLLNEAD